jgi:hypothetical protein
LQQIFDGLVTSQWNLYYSSISPPKMKMHQFSTSLAMPSAIALLELTNPMGRITKELLVMDVVESVRLMARDEGRSGTFRTSASHSRFTAPGR